MRNSIVAICIIVKLGASWNYSHSQNSNGWDGGGEESRAGAVLITASPLRRLGHWRQNIIVLALESQ